LIAVVLTVVLTTLIASRLGSRLRETLTAVERIAQGDLLAPLPSSSPDEIGALIAAVEGMQQSLRQAISLTRDSAHQVAASARELKRSAAEVPASTCAQSSAPAATAANAEAQQG